MTEHDISNLIDTWNQRLENYKEDYPPYDDGYKIALSECINDLLNLSCPIEQHIDFILSKEVEYYLESQEADRHPSSMEAHDIAV